MQGSRHTHEPYAVQTTAASPWPRRQQNYGTSTCTCDLLVLRARMPLPTKQTTRGRGHTEAYQTTSCFAWTAGAEGHRESQKAGGTEARQSTADLTGDGGTAARGGISRDAPGVYRRPPSKQVQHRERFGLQRTWDAALPTREDHLLVEKHAFFLVLEPELLGAGPPSREESIPSFLSRSDKNKCPGFSWITPSRPRGRANVRGNTQSGR